MKNLLCYLPNPVDATSLYRAVGPLQSLKRTSGIDFDIKVNVEPATWALMKGIDAVFLQRPSTGNMLKVMDLAINSGKQVWIDYDDDLYEVPFYNRSHRVYGKQQTQNIMTDIIARADVVTVSTVALQRKLQSMIERVAMVEQKVRGLKLNPEKVVVVPNAYDTDFLQDPNIAYGERDRQRTLVAWRGSDTHDKDLWIHTPAIKEVVASNLDWTFNFIGQPFWLTLQELSTIPRIKNSTVVYTETLDPVLYFDFLKETRPAVMIVPLEDTAFNRAKSNIAWIEATHAGAITLAPDWEEWKKPGVVTYKGDRDFQRKLDALVRGNYDHAKQINDSRSYIAKNLTMEVVNKTRAKILESLWSRRKA